MGIGASESRIMYTETFQDCWFLTGATASGKTSVGLELAQRLHAEIVAVDSMTVYRGMDIGTAKPDARQRTQAPHHLLDVVDPDQEFSLVTYVRSVQRVVEQIRSRGREVLFVGGTPLYLKALLRGIFVGPPADWEFRQAVHDEVRTVGTGALHARLEQVDPLSAARLPNNDIRRIIRALEVYRATNRPISHWQTQFDEGAAAEECRVFALSWERPALHQRIRTRVESMFQDGLLDEVRGLQDAFPQWSRTAAQAVGYREVISYLRGDQSLESVTTRTMSRTRQFAKRQATWFRGLSECRFVPCDGSGTPRQLAQQILNSSLPAATRIVANRRGP